MVGAVTTLATDNEAIPRGKSVAEPGNTPVLEQLLSEADLYLYEAKLAGKARIQGSSEQQNRPC